MCREDGEKKGFNTSLRHVLALTVLASCVSVKFLGGGGGGLRANPPSLLGVARKMESFDFLELRHQATQSHVAKKSASIPGRSC